MKSNLKELRRAKGLTLRTLKEKSGVSIGYLHELESDEANPTLTVAYAVSKVLKKPINKIWTI